MNFYRIAALVLGSSPFFLVSCTTGVIVGTNVIARMEARDSLRGDTPHTQAYLIAELPGASKKIETFQLDELDKFKTLNPEASFLLSATSGNFAIGNDGEKISYVVVSSKPATQIIEVTYSYENGTFFRYEATEKTIKPMYTRLWYHGYTFGAFPYALAFAGGLFFVGKRMRRRLTNKSTLQS